MRIFLFQAFASNNSGSYTIVGTFRDAATAESVAKTLTQVTAEHDTWHKEHEWDEDGISPLDEFAKQFGLHDAKPGRGDEWPSYEGGPTVLVSGSQVLVHAPYTVTMPRAYGEFFYANGGRVQVELDHAHHDLAVEFSFWLHYNDPAKEEKLDVFEARIKPELGALTVRRDYDQRPPIEPAWYRGDWGSRHLSVVFLNLVDGVAFVGRIAKELGIDMRLNVSECPGDVVDPFATLRGGAIPGGIADVIVWKIGDRIAAMKAVREVLGCALDEAKKAIADVPTEVLNKVDITYAKKAVDTLEAAGCEAEVVVSSKREC